MRVGEAHVDHKDVLELESRPFVAMQPIWKIVRASIGIHEAWRKTSQGGSQDCRLSCLHDTMAHTSEGSSSTLQL